jgi:hypothetical protein
LYNMDMNILSKSGDFMRRHPWISGGVAVGTGLVALEGFGLASNQTTAVPKGACLTPFAVSRFYRPDGDMLTVDTGISAGVAASSTVPKNALGEVAAWRNPGREWHRSQMVPVTGEKVLKFATGGGEVQDAVAEVFAEGSSECDTPPDVRFTAKDIWTYLGQAGRLPWPGGNVIANDFTALGKL